MTKTLKKTILLGFAAIASVSTFAQSYKSFTLDKVSSEAKGVYYCLPRTELVFDVTIEKINEYKGCYADYAYMLGLKNIVIEDATRYRIKDIRVRTRSIADNQSTYFLTFDAKTDVQLSPIGTLLGVNMPENLMPPQPKGECHKPKRHCKPQEGESTETKSTFERRMLRSGMLEAYPEMTPEQIVKQIASLRERQVDILSGSIEGTYMNTTVDFMYKQIDEMIDAYVSLFSGERVSQELHYTFTVEPEKPLIVEQDLLVGVFKFSETEGVKPLSYTGDIPTVVANLHSLNTTKALAVTEAQKAKDEKLQERIAKKGVGVYYRIPEKVELSISYGEKIFSKTLSISQFGQTTFLIESPKSLQFSPCDGSLLHISK